MRKSRTRKSRTRNKYETAGEAIAAGGFGCVFRPALKCQGVASRTSGISKLLLSHYAKEEYEEVKKFSPILKKIPHHDLFFLGTSLTYCSPANLTSADKVDFDKKCSNLTKSGITASNINSKLKDLRILNSPDGGVDIDFWIEKDTFTPQKFNILNKGLIRLLYNGIVPMNKNNLFHFDIKSANILVGPDNNFRLIDWGLAGISSQSKIIPSAIENRVIQYNVPFSNILFNTTFNDWYARELIKDKTIKKDSPILLDKMRNIAVNYYYYWQNQVGKGHHDYLKSIFYEIYGSNLSNKVTNRFQVLDYLYTEESIIDYLAHALIEFTNFDNHKFDQKLYFTEVFSKNCDIWGLIMAYYPIFYLKRKYPSKFKIASSSSKITDEFLMRLQNIFTRYLFSPYSAANAINRGDLIKDLQKLSVVAGQPIPSYALSQTIQPTTTKTGPPLPKGKKIGPPLPRIGTKLRGIFKKIVPTTMATKKSSTKKLSRRDIFTWPLDQKCPKGTRRNKKSGKCESPQAKTKKITLPIHKPPIRINVLKSASQTQKKQKRCPKGYHRNKKTGNCEPIKI